MCRTFDVSYKIAPPANATIAKAKMLPRLNPKMMPDAMNPSATKPPIINTGPKKEKSLRVKNTTAVKPKNKPSVVIPALANNS